MASLTEGVNGYDATRENVLRDLKTFYFDTALSANPHTLPSLLSFAAPDHVLFGSDWPYARGDNAQFFTQELDAYPLSGAQRRAINHENALTLLPRFRRRAAPTTAGLRSLTGHRPTPVRSPI